MTPPAGRPEIGPMITLRLTPEDLHAVGQAAASTGISRAEWLRRAAADHLALPRQEIVGLVPWLIRQGIDADEIGNLIEKPYKYPRVARRLRARSRPGRHQRHRGTP